ncbi:MAG: glycine-rich protein [Coriobacteriia bacterium]|nr:glycine-rich protein [Coriobacteriia bacterium]
MMTTRLVQIRPKSAASTAGFTLVEIIVSFAILAIVSASVIAAIIGLAATQQIDAQTREDNAAVEQSIATGAAASERDEFAELPLGEFSLPAAAEIHIQGLGGYTVLGYAQSVDPDSIYLDGDVAYVLKHWVVKTGFYRIEVWGASGGNGARTAVNTGNSDIIYDGGRGGYASGIVRLQRGQSIYLYAGGAGVSASRLTAAHGGANGGGAGLVASSGQDSLRGSGGGASDVRIETDSPYARVIVAGGGGGGGGERSNQTGTARAGGFGGGNFGSAGGSSSQAGIPIGQGQNNAVTGAGGTLSAGGLGGFYYNNQGGVEGTPGAHGSFGQGGASGIIGNNSHASGGGGGGWYGGGGGGGGAGGGSGWAYTQANYNSWSHAADKGAYLLDTHWLMTQVDIRSGNSSMPDPRNGGLMTGMRGNGYVKVTWVGATQ